MFEIVDMEQMTPNVKRFGNKIIVATNEER